MNNENEMTEEELSAMGKEVSEEATGLSAAVGFLTSGRHPVVCVMGLLAVAAHHAQHGEIDKDAFLELADNMWKTAQENHSSACKQADEGDEAALRETKLREAKLRSANDALSDFMSRKPTRQH